jgi:hypothetical protein
MAQRDGRLSRDHHIRGRLNNRGSAEHDLSPTNQGIVCCVGEAGRAALRRRQKGVDPTGQPFGPELIDAPVVATRADVDQPRQVMVIAPARCVR